MSEAWRPFVAACKAWWLELNGGGDGDLCFCGEWATVEAAIHELAHAVLLGIAPDPSILDAENSSALSKLSKSAQREDEARAWAIECLVCERLGIPVGFGEAVDAADMQDVSIEEMERAFAAPERWSSHVDEVLAHLEQWKADQR